MSYICNFLLLFCQSVHSKLKLNLQTSFQNVLWPYPSNDYLGERRLTVKFSEWGLTIE